jgi:hypothetical protein
MDDTNEKKSEREDSKKIIVAENGDLKYVTNKDWKIYDPEKYQDPEYSPDLE